MVKPTKCAAATMLAIQIQSIAAHPQIGLPQPPRKMQQNRDCLDIMRMMPGESVDLFCCILLGSHSVGGIWAMRWLVSREWLPHSLLYYPAKCNRTVSGANQPETAIPIALRAKLGRRRLTQPGRQKYLADGLQKRNAEAITGQAAQEKRPSASFPHIQARLLARNRQGDLEQYPAFIHRYRIMDTDNIRREPGNSRQTRTTPQSCQNLRRI